MSCPSVTAVPTGRILANQPVALQWPVGWFPDNEISIELKRRYRPSTNLCDGDRVGVRHRRLRRASVRTVRRAAPDRQLPTRAAMIADQQTGVMAGRSLCATRPVRGVDETYRATGYMREVPVRASACNHPLPITKDGPRAGLPRQTQADVAPAKS